MNEQQMSVTDKSITCAACGGTIVQGVGADKDFCSLPCYRAGRAFCKCCGKPLQQGRRRIFCDDLCGQRDRYLDTATSLTVLEERKRTVCKACGKPITQPKHGVKQFCSRSCTWRFHTLAKRGQHLDLTQKFGSYAPQTRKIMYELENAKMPGTAKRLAAAIDREYVLRKQGPKNIKGQYIICHCKSCGREFNRRSSSLLSRDYCSRKCHPSGRNRGEASPHAMLTWEQVDEIRDLYATTKISQEALGNKYGVSKSNIRRIIHYETWKPDNDPKRKGAITR